MRLGRRGNETRLIIQSASQQRPVDQKLLNLIARGFAWREEIILVSQSRHPASATVMVLRGPAFRA